MEKDDKQVMVIITNLKNSNKDLWYKIMNMPIEISRLTSELDEALKELRDLKEYIANLNIDDLGKDYKMQKGKLKIGRKNIKIYKKNIKMNSQN